jgi:tetratricopeptide (TPR) repeat protein
VQAKKLRDRGQCQKALDLFAQATELEPENAAALAGRGWCYLDLSRYALAESSFQQALEQDRNFAEALMGLGETYRFQGRRADAVKYYEQYLAARPEGEDAVAARNAISKLKE